MQAVEDELPVPSEVMAALNELYSVDDALVTFTVRHPLGVEVLELQKAPWTAKAMRGKKLDFILAPSNFF
jgi:hypothetical protein